MSELLFASARVVLPTGIAPATVRVRDEQITAVQPLGASARGATVIDLGDAILLPGLVDTHVHVNEPGRTEWEGFASATRAAAAGGVTTILDMPLNAVPATTNAAALVAKRASRRTVPCDVWIHRRRPFPATPASLRRCSCWRFRLEVLPGGFSPGGVPRGERGNAARSTAQLAAWDLPLMVHA